MANNKLYGYTPDPSKEKEGNRLDRLNPYEFRKGMDYELTALGCYRLAESTLEEREKSTEKVIKNLEEYGGYYSALIQYETEYRNPVEGQSKPSFKSYLKEIEDYQMIEVDKKYTHDKMVEPKYKKEEYTVPFKTGKMGNFKLKALKEAIKKEIRRNLLEGVGPSACPPISCAKTQSPGCCEGYAQHPVTCRCVRASSLNENIKCYRKNLNPDASFKSWARCACSRGGGCKPESTNPPWGPQGGQTTGGSGGTGLDNLSKRPIKTHSTPDDAPQGRRANPVYTHPGAGGLYEAKKDKDVYDMDDAEPTKAQLKGIDKSIGDAKEALAQAMKIVKELGPDIKKLAKETNEKIKKNPAGKTDYLKTYTTNPDVKEFIKLRKMLKSADLL